MEGTAAAEDSLTVAAGAGDGAVTEKEAVTEGEEPQGEEKEADASQVTHAATWESVRGTGPDPAS